MEEGGGDESGVRGWSRGGRKKREGGRESAGNDCYIRIKI